MSVPSISLCMIVKNEEQVLARCLESVHDLVDEIIIVDTGSTDRTREEAGKYTDKIYDFPWNDDFSAARNYSYRQATGEYILWLDADDVILPPDRLKFKGLKETLPSSVDVVMMPYHAALDEQGRPTFIYLRERLSKRTRNYQWREPVHEYLAYSGNVFISDVCITHLKESAPDPERNLRIYRKILAQGGRLSSRGLYYYARELKDHGLYDEAIQYFSQFLDSNQGWVEDKINACLALAHCYREKGDHRQSLAALLSTFAYDLPRAEACCEIGYHFKNSGNPEQAIFWFELALQLKKPEHPMGFLLEDCWGFLPAVELCVLYYQIGNQEKALEYHLKAASYKPDDPAVIFNHRFFGTLASSEDPS